MDGKEKQAFLAKYTGFSRSLSRLREEAEQWEALAQAAASEDAAQTLQRIREDIRRLSREREAIVRAVEGLEDAQQREVVALRYLSGMTWKEVGAALFIDERWARRLHERALSCIEVKP